MQRPHSSNIRPSESAEARVLAETLRQTSSAHKTDLETIREHAGTTFEVAETVLKTYLDSAASHTITIDHTTRFAIAQRAVQLGAIEQVAKVLTWQEFETFGEDCLRSVGFQAWKGLVLKDEKRRWQVDLTAKKGPMVLSIDCKHWNSPSYPSKLAAAAEHQRLALPPLLKRIKLRQDAEEPLWVLPVVLTLLDPRSRVLNNAALVSVNQFSDFLEHVTPYDSDLPFISADDLKESSMSHHPAGGLESY